MKKLLYILLPIIVGIIVSVVFKSTLVTVISVIVAAALSAYLARADILFLIGSHKYVNNKQDGLIWIKRAFETDRLSPRSTLLYAYLLLRAGDTDRAESIINKTVYLGKKLLSDADLKNADLNRALIYWKQGKLNDAILTCEELYENGYNTASLFGSLAYFYIANNEYDKSIELSLTGRALYPENVIIADNLGQAYIQTSSLDQAEEIYKEIFEKNPDFAEPFFNYGQLMEKRGELAEAVQYYQKALECEEKFMSTVNHHDIEQAIEKVNDILK